MFVILWLLQGCLRCPPEHLPSKCYSSDGKCYLVYCGLGGWMEASNLCHTYNSQFAILNTNNAAKTALEKINYLGNACTNFWIGLSNFQWKFGRGMFIKRVVYNNAVTTIYFYKYIFYKLFVCNSK